MLPSPHIDRVAHVPAHIRVVNLLRAPPLAVKVIAPGKGPNTKAPGGSTTKAPEDTTTMAPESQSSTPPQAILLLSVLLKTNAYYTEGMKGKPHTLFSRFF